MWLTARSCVPSSSGGGRGHALPCNRCRPRDAGTSGGTTPQPPGDDGALSSLPDSDTATPTDTPADLPSDALALAVTFTLTQHRYPRLNEKQRFELRVHLAHLLNGAPGTPCPGGIA